MEHPNVTADAVGIAEYPQLAQRYHVMGVPKTMINGQDGIEGALPESAFIDAVLAAAQPHDHS